MRDRTMLRENRKAEINNVLSQISRFDSKFQLFLFSAIIRFVQPLTFGLVFLHIWCIYCVFVSNSIFFSHFFFFVEMCFVRGRLFARISNIHYLVNLALVPNRKSLFAVMDMQFKFSCRNEHLYAQWFPLFYWIDSAYFGKNHKILKSRSIQYNIECIFSFTQRRERTKAMWLT